ncbi:MAG: hypothetical protein B5M51_02860 [Anaerolinea sp. 4484_236]|nr:MAG: hypothetical protein B5M51_02860 [Anaerolinea sp. 4484_236]
MNLVINMKTKTILLFSIPLIFVFLFGLSFSAQASPSPQIGEFQTPTPGADGRIIYTVREGDSCTRIELLHSISNDQLRALNPELDENCTIYPGQKLLMGIGGPAAAGTPTPGPSPTPTQPLPTPTPFTGTTEICVLLFEDINGDALRQEAELGLAGGAVSVTNAKGGYSQTQNTTGELDLDTGEPVSVCFADVPEGEYNISVAIPDGYNPTIEVSYKLEVQAGDRAFVDFGAQSQTSTADPVGDEGNGSSGLLGVLGAVLLLGGLGLGWYAMRLRKPAKKFDTKGLN